MVPSVSLDDSVLDSAEQLTAGDPGEMLRAIATSGAQIREAATLAADAGLEVIAADGRPRAIVVLGMGGSGIAGDVLAALCGHESPIPIHVIKGYGLPGWVGATDLVIGVSCSGSTEETLSGFEEALRRGCRMLGVGAVDSPLAFIAERGRAPFIPVRSNGRLPRSMTWALSVPLLGGGAARAGRCLRAGAGGGGGPAGRARGPLPAGKRSLRQSGQGAGACAGRLAADGLGLLADRQRSRHTGSPASGTRTPSFRRFAGRFPRPTTIRSSPSTGLTGRGGGSTSSPIPRTLVALRLVLLRDPSEEHPQVTRRAEISKDIAESRGVALTELVAEGESRLERLASLVGLIDYGSVYTALGLGIDPTPIAAIQDLKARIAG